MNSRERLLAALNHREPDRVPIDLGGTSTSTISLGALENLKSHLGIRSKTRLMNSITMTAHPDDEIIKRFGIDVKRVASNQPGGVEPLLRDLIELGVDAINPVQVGAAGMDNTRKLKATYGRDLTFWGGIDTQRTLPFGTPEDVRAEVRRRA